MNNHIDPTKSVAVYLWKTGFMTKFVRSFEKFLKKEGLESIHKSYWLMKFLYKLTGKT